MHAPLSVELAFAALEHHLLHVALQNALPEEEAEMLARELKRFLELKVLVGDYGDRLLMPSRKVLVAWRAMIMMPATYAAACRGLRALEVIDHYCPADTTTPTWLGARYLTTLGLYTTHFGAPPDEYFWPRNQWGSETTTLRPPLAADPPVVAVKKRKQQEKSCNT